MDKGKGRNTRRAQSSSKLEYFIFDRTAKISLSTLRNSLLKAFICQILVVCHSFCDKIKVGKLVICDRLSILLLMVMLLIVFIQCLSFKMESIKHQRNEQIFLYKKISRYRLKRDANYCSWVTEVNFTKYLFRFLAFSYIKIFSRISRQMAYKLNTLMFAHIIL